MRTFANLIDDPLVEGRFASWLKMRIDLIAPKNLDIISGRATAKSSDILAERSIRISEDMARAYFAWVADTYENAIGNVRDALIEGWNRKGWVEGVHYVLDERPPAHFEKPYKSPKDFQHTMSIYNGCFFKIVSLAQPSSAAGNSYQHLFGDEVKYFDDKKIAKLFPAIRGEYTNFGDSVYYRGHSFTTDMPNPMHKEYDWIMQQEENMDVEQIKLILNLSHLINEDKKKLFKAYKNRDDLAVKRIQKRIVKYTIAWRRARKDSTYFAIGSSLANLQILTLGYFEDSLKTLGIEEFKTSILSLKPTIPQGAMFYAYLGPHHFFDDGLREDFLSNYTLKEEFNPLAKHIKKPYYDKKQPVSAGMDFGDMISMVTGQENKNYIYALRNFFTLPPESTAQIASKFVDFYDGHEKRILNLYYDRSGNQYEQVNRDWATDVKTSIEEYSSKIGQKWKVNLMSKNQATIYQDEEYYFMTKWLNEGIAGIPTLRIYRKFNKELKSSLEITKVITKKDQKGKTKIHKNKTSEKLAMHLRPMYSTNFSDAFKYWIMRRDWRSTASSRISTSTTFIDTEII
ncbi:MULTISPECIES: hypothetical protein [unclassified Empedobacter]|uniref:hypothetical protein n=1 Tax=unclassified Empedobacter TaxID=2643773 RepID=UPI0025BA66E1|nr:MULTISPECIES: hypothetical protein [unclassified Empedobacter]